MYNSLLSPVRGMHDIVSPYIDRWQSLEKTASACFQSYGYKEIRTPIVESLDLFKRQLGEDSDVVQKEMYAFSDSLNGDMLTLRPEATVSTIRALLYEGMHRSGIVRVWYGGPMFRHERPQKGRYRQFHQLGAETLGGYDPAMEAEQIIMLARLWRELKVEKKLSLNINNLGSDEERANYRQALIDYLSYYVKDLDEDSSKRLHLNPLRIFDSKVERTQMLLTEAPKLSAFLGTESKRHVERVKDLLDNAGVVFYDTPSLVRGLDYYNLTVYEWVLVDDNRQQSTVCGGGRYDRLAKMISNIDMPGCGFALGMERLLDLVDVHHTPDISSNCYLIICDETYTSFADTIAEKCRDEGWTVMRHIGGGNLRKQMKRANAMGSALAIIIGEEEYSNNTVTLKRLSDGFQVSVEVDAVSNQMRKLVCHG